MIQISSRKVISVNGVSTRLNDTPPKTSTNATKTVNISSNGILNNNTNQTKLTVNQEQKNNKTQSII